MLCFRSRVFGISAAFADLGQPGMGAGTVGIGREGRLKLLLGLGQETLREIVAAQRGVFVRSLCWREGCHSGGTELIKREGSLSERGLRIISTDALHWSEAAVGVESGSGGSYGEMGTEGSGFGVVGLELQARVGLCQGGLQVSAAPECDGHVVAVVLV